MRVPWLCLLLAGCGRLDFARTDGSRDAETDTPGDVVAPDGPSSPGTVYLISGNGTVPTAVLTLDLTTGHVVQVGTLEATLGIFGGLGAWDANTLYATSGSNLVRITLVPFGSQVVRALGGNISSLERRGAILFGIDEGAGGIIMIDPTMPAGVIATTPLGITASGGDVVQVTDGTWYYFSNSGPQLYRFDLANTPIAVGGPATGAPFVSGLIRDAADQLYLTSSGSNQVIALDRTTGQVGAATQLCDLCPAPYDLLSGDATRLP